MVGYINRSFNPDIKDIRGSYGNGLRAGTGRPGVIVKVGDALLGEIYR